MTIKELADKIFEEIQNREENFVFLYTTIVLDYNSKLNELLNILSSNKKRTLLIDGNFPHKKGKHIHLMTNDDIEQMVSQSVTEVRDHIIGLGIPNIYYLSFETVIKDSFSSYLLSNGIAEIIDDLKFEYDVIILYSSNLLKFVDTQILLGKIPNYTIDINIPLTSTDRERLSELVEENDSELLGIIEKNCDRKV
jgi:hypothetical protein